MKDKESNESSFIGITALLILLVLFIALSIGAYSYKFGVGLWDTPEKWGSLGDFFGGVLNPFIGFLTVFLLLFTLKQNQKALEQNAEELKLTREELSDSKTALQEQASILTKQTFEGTFFQLLSLHQDLTNAMDFYNKDTKHTTTGKDCFKVLYNRFSKTAKQDFKSEYQVKSTNPFEIMEESRLEGIRLDKVTKEIECKEYISQCYSLFMKENSSEVSHYFKSLYNIIKFVDDGSFSSDYIYINTIRSQLSNYEAALLFYNEIYNSERSKFKGYIEKYALFKSMNTDLLLNKGIHMKFYKDSAFGVD